ncbi:hypothetical protein CLOLEP_01554 [[Clostridium] leptum DSM 753]|uniref:Uncharacterized protein n=1 Tax=[Clostridium] leptum DSM 753 TaxID=428125 RepID=A7VSL3_9FIRM|nr:hypothetical protein CLOLEP_01554 [[Clostridium] leptum DSM 753]
METTSDGFFRERKAYPRKVVCFLYKLSRNGQLVVRNMWDLRQLA